MLVSTNNVISQRFKIVVQIVHIVHTLHPVFCTLAKSFSVCGHCGQLVFKLSTLSTNTPDR
jgi:hypothetical protein